MNDYEKYRGLTRSEIRDDLFKDYKPENEKIDPNSLKAIFGNELTERDKLWIKFSEILDYLGPNEEEELKKLGFELTYDSMIGSNHIRKYEDEKGRKIEINNSLSDVTKFEGKSLPYRDKISEIAGIDDWIALGDLREMVKESNKDSYRTNFNITGSLGFETKANDEENAEEIIEKKMDKIYKTLSKECPGLDLEIEYSQIEKQ